MNILKSMRVSYFRQFYFICFPIAYWLLKIAQWDARKNDLLRSEVPRSGVFETLRTNLINRSNLGDSDLFFFYAMAFIVIVAVYFFVPFLVRAIKRSEIRNKMALVLSTIACYGAATFIVFLVAALFAGWLYEGRMFPNGADIMILAPDFLGLLSLDIYPLSFVGECLVLLLTGLVLSIPNKE